MRSTTAEHNGIPILTAYHAFGLDPLPERVIDFTKSAAHLGVHFVQAIAKDPRLDDVMRRYIHEHALPNTVDARRAVQGAMQWVLALGPDFDCSKIKRADGRTVIEFVQARGCKPGTVRRVMAVGRAGLYHAKKEGVIASVPVFPDVRGGAPRVRWLSREEHAVLMAVPKPQRLQDFYIIAFATGARSQAIEQLTVDRVDFKARTIDFRMPGVDHKNKRRAVVHISDSLLPHLQRMCAGKKPNEPVIGYGARGRITSTYYHAKIAMRDAGIDEDGCARHVARHTVASWLLQGDPERGIPATPIHLVANLLGDTVAMIERTYGHLQPKHIASAVNALL